jgi:hypothetical protein
MIFHPEVILSMSDVSASSSAAARAISSVIGTASRSHPPAAVDSVTQWRDQWRGIAARTAHPLEQAILGGFAADRLGWAFASGYQAALRMLAPALQPGELAGFCVTEEGGNRPKDVRTEIAPHADEMVSVDGAKRWAMFGSEIDVLLVVGALRPAAGASEMAGAALRPHLRTIRVPARSTGVSFEDMPPTRFIPEVPHARVVLRDVRLAAAALLDGDGYADHVKPFRSIEDVHVTCAALAYLLREASVREWSASYRERLAAAIMAAASIPTGQKEESPSMHIVLSGTLQWAKALYEEADTFWTLSPQEGAAVRWQRDKPLLNVASTARGLRTAAAWQRLTGSADFGL